LGVIAAVVVFRRHRLAPLAAAWIGLPIALGVISAHLLPHWSALSDPFVGDAAPGVTAVSWTVVLVEVLGAGAMGLIGLAMLRQRTFTARAA
jgi:hypothetical protein